VSVRYLALSGLRPKEPAAFLVEAAGKRILFDLGQGPRPEDRPDPARSGRIDALVLSHAHKDHAGAIDLVPAIGDPVVHATPSVLDRLPPQSRSESLPLAGETVISGIAARTGRSGHALGGVWSRLDVAGGVLYMGDHFAQSDIFAYDPPPPSRLVVLDASYGDDDEPRERQARDILARAKREPLLLPVPADGRALELALALSASGLPVAVDEAVRAMLARLGGSDSGSARPGAAQRAAHLAESALSAAPDAPGPILAADATGERGTAARLIDAALGSHPRPILFTGHLEPGSRGRRLVEAGRAAFRRWNVHPTASDNAALVHALSPEIIVPAFGDAALEIVCRAD
jgi:Cft2 family RNA processing exonuclease